MFNPNSNIDNYRLLTPNSFIEFYRISRKLIDFYRLLSNVIDCRYHRMTTPGLNAASRNSLEIQAYSITKPRTLLKRKFV